MQTVNRELIKARFEYKWQACVKQGENMGSSLGGKMPGLLAYMVSPVDADRFYLCVTSQYNTGDTS